MHLLLILLLLMLVFPWFARLVGSILHALFWLVVVVVVLALVGVFSH